MAVDVAGGKREMKNGKAKMANRNSTAPAIKVRARFRGGVLYPLEDINLADGAEVEILLRPAKQQ